MFYSFILLLANAGKAFAECQEEAGNYYCNPAGAVQYQNVGFNGVYQEVTDMNVETGQCLFQDFAFEGDLAPLNQEISLHFRGPLTLEKFAAYKLVNAPRKRELNEETVVVWETIVQTVIVDAPVETNIPTFSTKHSKPESQENSHVPNHEAVNSRIANAKFAPVSNENINTEPVEQILAKGKALFESEGHWARDSFYDSTSNENENVVFLNNFGNEELSGTWDTKFGNSLSYASPDLKGAAKGPEIPPKVSIGSNMEFSIWTSQNCDDQCGYYRPKTVAHKGFDPKDRLFLMRVIMPHDAETSPDVLNYDMPAIWALNGKISRTQQYGACSCWPSGCGEVDFLEVLNSGNNKLTSHIHCSQGAPPNTQAGGGGTSDYILRPGDKFMDVAVLFRDRTITIVDITSKNIQFSSDIDDAEFAGWPTDSNFPLP